MPATVKNSSQKPITITICNQRLLKLSVIREIEINDKAYCFTRLGTSIPEQFLGLIGIYFLTQHD